MITTGCYLNISPERRLEVSALPGSSNGPCVVVRAPELVGANWELVLTRAQAMAMADQLALTALALPPPAAPAPTPAPDGLDV